jgi:putative addiction module CopG family antidote
LQRYLDLPGVATKSIAQLRAQQLALATIRRGRCRRPSLAHQRRAAILIDTSEAAQRRCLKSLFSGIPPRIARESIAYRRAGDFVTSKVAAARYSSSSEVVREALRLMEKIERQEADKFRFLRNSWQEGIDSGEVGAPHIPLAVIANWGVPQPVAEGG